MTPQLLLLLQHPCTQAIQIQACLILCVGMVGWTLSGLRRRREAIRLLAAGYSSILQKRAGMGNHTAPCAPAGKRSAAPAQPLQAETNNKHGTAGISCSAGTKGGCADMTLAHGDCLAHNSSGSTYDCWHTLLQKKHECCQQLPSRSSIFASSHSLWPPLAVVLPVKGCRPYSSANWHSQLSAQYDGPAVLVFVVESPSDPAVPTLTTLMQQQQGAMHIFPLLHQQQQQQKHMQQQQQHNHEQQWPSGVLSVWRQQQQQGYERLVVLAYAGLATTCSQKIHNILKGIEIAQPLLQQWQQQQQKKNHTQLQKQQAGIASKQQLQQQQQDEVSCSRKNGYCKKQQEQQLCVDSSGSLHIHAVATQGCATPIAAAAAAPDRSARDQTAAEAAEAEAAAGSGGYVCVLDDDVLLHPLSLMQLVDQLEVDQSLFMATGYPFDIVAESSSSSNIFGRLLSYAAASYHLPLTIGVSAADRGSFVWGGAMMLRAAALQEQPPLHLWQQCRQQQAREKQQQQQVPNLLQVWRDGGYSDDLLAAAYCGEQQLQVSLPAAALYPQLLPASITLKQYWNYLRRQLFVLDTYYSDGSRTAHHTMMSLHSYGSAVFTLAVAATVTQLLLLAGLAAGSSCCWLLRQLRQLGGLGGGDWGLGGVAFAAGALRGIEETLDSLLAAGCSQLGLLSTCSSSSSATAPSSCHSVFARSVMSPGLVVFVTSVLVAHLTIWFCFTQCLLLLRVLSPNGAAVGGRQQQQQPCISFAMLWAGWVLENAVLPVCMAYTYCHDRIVWGGIRYTKRAGRVVEVLHPKP